MPSHVQIVTESPEETREVGRRLGSLAQGGEVFLLVGPLGAGKTCFTQGVAWGLGVQEYARSPTFVMVTQYQGRLMLYHVDLYRVDSLGELQELGLDEYLYGRGVSVVEWADKALAALPPEHLLVTIEYVGESSRRFTFQAAGHRHRVLLEGLKAKA